MVGQEGMILDTFHKNWAELKLGRFEMPGTA
jgi:hypothetical protein